jgi:ABC-2 type transport system permease protein
MLSLLAIFVGGVAMVISIVTARANLAIMLAMLLGVVMYAWSSFLPLADAIAQLAWLSPWHHYIATEPMATGIDWPSAALLAILATVPLVISVYLFKRRDIPA